MLNKFLLLIFSQSDYLIQIVDKFTFSGLGSMANSADPDQLASFCFFFLHFLQRQGISGLSRTRVKFKDSYGALTHVLLNPDIPCFANSVGPDQLASEEAN